MHRTSLSLLSLALGGALLGCAQPLRSPEPAPLALRVTQDPVESAPSDGTSRGPTRRPDPDRMSLLSIFGDVKEDPESTWTRIDVEVPTLLSPYRDDDLMIRELGEARISVQFGEKRFTEPNAVFHQTSFPAGHLWLHKPGSWFVHCKGLAEPGTETRRFELPYVAIPNPSKEEVVSAQFGREATKPAYHAETVTEEWEEILSFRTRWAGVHAVTITVRGGDLRMRFGGKPEHKRQGIAYDLLLENQLYVFEGPTLPLASVWARSEADEVVVNIVSYRTH